ncbi:DUF2391 family protein [Sphingomicrobium marinum]|uniref:DUF2391 family protein n=1 Tax=Sphingomicrobium marinum TaxID=1227950 RepID=UPI002240455E|nr:DUF2391 family protein [Sphingomicrobium marinum]
MVAVTSWDYPICDGDVECPAGEVEIRDLARGLAGALFVSLPLLFTMEMWHIARTIPDTVLLVFLGVAFVAIKFFLDFAGYRRTAWQRSRWWDALVAMGLGAIASIVTLSVTALISPSMDFYLVTKLVALESIPTGIGAAVAINQLGGGDARESSKVPFSPDVTVILGTALGGFLFAFNVAPTIETKVVVLNQTWVLVGLTLLLSLAVSYMTVSIAAFEERDLSQRKVITSEWLETIISYLMSFLISLLLLWVFGYGTPLDPLEVWLPQAIALAYATTLGGAAGRLIL